MVLLNNQIQLNLNLINLNKGIDYPLILLYTSILINILHLLHLNRTVIIIISVIVTTPKIIVIIRLIEINSIILLFPICRLPLQLRHLLLRPIPQCPHRDPLLRTPGWDINSNYFNYNFNFNLNLLHDPFYYNDTHHHIISFNCHLSMPHLSQLLHLDQAEEEGMKKVKYFKLSLGEVQS